MDKLEVILEKIKNLNMKKEIEDHILYKIDSIKSHILDVITYSKTYDEIKDNVPFPAFFDSDNGILYAYQTRHNNKPAFFVLVWKNGELSVELMNYDLTAKSAFRNPNKSDIIDEKEESNNVEILDGVPEEKDELSQEKLMESIPEEKDELSQEELDLD
tara:strand:+ start:7839 stop:8315 length:477 start_codon:yes stop_codon:yes gene_type:complete